MQVDSNAIDNVVNVCKNFYKDTSKVFLVDVDSNSAVCVPRGKEKLNAEDSINKITALYQKFFNAAKQNKELTTKLNKTSFHIHMLHVAAEIMQRSRLRSIHSIDLPAENAYSNLRRIENIRIGV